MKLKVRQFLNSLLKSNETETDLVIMCGSLLKLQNSVRHATFHTDPLAGVVELFNSAAEFEDKNELAPLIKRFENVNYGQHDLMIEKLKALDGHLKALRKYNNQGAGEILTLSNVSIGKFSGLNAFVTAHLLSIVPRDIKVTARTSKIIEDHALKISPIIEYLLQAW